jgi:hypothetical protein
MNSGRSNAKEQDETLFLGISCFIAAFMRPFYNKWRPFRMKWRPFYKKWGLFYIKKRTFYSKLRPFYIKKSSST